MILSARRKFRKSEATRRSWRNNRWKISFGREFQAMVSVTAVKIQFSSPSMDLRSVTVPGILSIISWLMFGLRRLMFFWRTYQRKAILIGVVRQEVKRSAGSSWFIGRSSVSLQAPRRISWIGEEVGRRGVICGVEWLLVVELRRGFWARFFRASSSSFSMESANFTNRLRITPACEQSKT